MKTLSKYPENLFTDDCFSIDELTCNCRAGDFVGTITRLIADHAIGYCRNPSDPLVVKIMFESDNGELFWFCLMGNDETLKEGWRISLNES